MPAVLCIDDDDITLTVCKAIIAKTHLFEEVVTAMNGQEALDFYNALMEENAPPEKFPGLIFLDLTMPVMDGWEFLDKFTTNYQYLDKTKIAILTSSVNPAEKRRALQYPGVIDFISKPLTAPVVVGIFFKTIFPRFDSFSRRWV